MVPLVFVGVAAIAAAYGLFAQWAVNAPAFGERDAGWALFFAFSAAIAFTVTYWLVPVALLAATAVTLTQWGSPWLYVLAAVLAAVPFLVLR